MVKDITLSGGEASPRTRHTLRCHTCKINKKIKIKPTKDTALKKKKAKKKQTK